MAPVCFSGLGLGVAARANVGEGDLLGGVTCIVSDADVVVLHVRSRDAVDAFAGVLLLGVPTTVPACPPYGYFSGVLRAEARGRTTRIPAFPRTK